MNDSSEAAKQISDYLTTGMHHATPEGQRAIAAIIEKAIDKAQLPAPAFWRMNLQIDA